MPITVQIDPKLREIADEILSSFTRNMTLPEVIQGICEYLATHTVHIPESYRERQIEFGANLVLAVWIFSFRK